MAEEEQTDEEKNPLEMPDEDIINGSPPEEVFHLDEGEGVEEVSTDVTQEQEGEGETAPKPEEKQVTQQKDVFEEGGEEPAPKAKKSFEKTKTVKDEPVSDEPGSTGDIDYQAEYERLMMPFKANGRQMQVHNVNDALQLMQMGANYNKKMAGLKPNLKLMKMLEKNELLNEEKLSFLIDLQKKDPAAIAQFMKNAEVDPLDIDMDKSNEYKPKAYTVDDKEIDLDSILEEIQDTPKFQETIDIISNKWDASSKQVLLDNPSLIKVINEHVESGIYNSIHDIVESERAMNKLQGMTDIEAYKHVGDVIQANGGFNQQPQEGSQGETQPEATGQQQPNAKTSKLNDQRRAASSTKSSPAAGGKPDYNPLNMSDDEFEKAAGGMM